MTSTTDPRWARVERPTFTLHRDNDGIERITIDGFPDVIAIAGRFLDEVDPHLVRRHRASNTVRIEAANGWCSYGIVAYDPARDQYLCERLPAMGDAR